MSVVLNNIDTVTFNNVTVGSSSTSIIAANAKRTYLRLTNDSNENIYITLGSTAALMNKGISVLANGGYYEINQNNLWQGEIRGICTSGGKVMMYLEGSKSS